MLAHKRILLIIGGGIAAYKSLELIRLLKRDGAFVRCVLTKGGEQFVTPLSVAAISGEKVYQDLFSLTDEAEMGHIQLSRDADLLVVAPATANLLAQMVAGMAPDLALTALLATDKPVLVVPAMNVRMWEHPATQRNIAQLKADGIVFAGPREGTMACGEYGMGRMLEPHEIVDAIKVELLKPVFAKPHDKPLAGKHVVVTAGPTHEAIDPVRYIANHSSGRQGYALAKAAHDAGARVTLVSGPTHLPDPGGIAVIRVTTALEMLAAVNQALPADIAICAAAVADWRVDGAGSKLKKTLQHTPELHLVENPDILKTVANAASRPSLVVGFAAETDNLLEHAKDKLARKSCDMIVANLVGANTDVFGSDFNQVHLLTKDEVTSWPRLSKDEIARKLVLNLTERLEQKAKKAESL